MMTTHFCSIKHFGYTQVQLIQVAHLHQTLGQDGSASDGIRVGSISSFFDSTDRTLFHWLTDGSRLTSHTI